MEQSSGGSQAGSAHSTVQENACREGASGGTEVSLSNSEFVGVEGGGGDDGGANVVAGDAMMCPMCAFSSCDREAIMQHVMGAH
ncbi:unnamed protein product [Hydatigera taeniaeformis]|uniref:C2H2-type domain-containing protein n=1 Tax=Hydatigena taeniaeformis TaxID=6205 RepID=A0A0R3WHX8_HYDTA|nr:unnamed protein product [Hydatigera taeniaeformis]